ncbi:MAG: hypothetical protein ACM31C_00980 [Acidobacteriota bacterium]
MLRCTPDNEHALVFQMMHGSFGTLGVLTQLVFRLVPAKPDVRVDYETYVTLDAYRAAIRRHVDAQDLDFMDGILSFYAHMEDTLFLDLASYGMKQPPGVHVHRLIEAKLRELGGVKTLISHNYYSPEEFWSIWNERNYDRVKSLVDPRNLFRDVYAKTCRAAMGLPDLQSSHGETRLAARAADRARTRVRQEEQQVGGRAPGR